MPPRGRRRGVKRGGGTAGGTESGEPEAAADTAGQEEGSVSIEMNLEAGEMSPSGVMDEDLVVLDETDEDDAENNLEGLAKKLLNEVGNEETETKTDKMDTSTAATEAGSGAGNEEKSMSVDIATAGEQTDSGGKDGNAAEGVSEEMGEEVKMDSTASATKESDPVQAVSASTEKPVKEEIKDVEMEEKAVIVIEDDPAPVTDQNPTNVAPDMKGTGNENGKAQAKTGDNEAGTSAVVTEAGGEEEESMEDMEVKSEVIQSGDEEEASTSAAGKSMEQTTSDTATPQAKLNANGPESTNKVVISPVVSQENKKGAEESKQVGKAKGGQQKKQQGKQAAGADQNKAKSTEDKPAGGGNENYISPPKSFLKLKQLTVNIGPLRQLDLMSRELHEVLKLSDEFNVNFELKEKKLEDGTSKKEKCGFVRVPFKMKSPGVLVMVAEKLGCLRIDGRDMSVKFPDVFNNAINDCKEYVKKKKERQNENKKRKKELKQRQIQVEGLPDTIEVETMQAEFPEAVKVYVNKSNEADGTAKVKYVMMEFTTKEDCLKVFNAKKGCKIGEKKVFLKYLGTEMQQSPAPKKQAKPARGRFNQGRFNFSARGRGMAATGRGGSQAKSAGGINSATNRGGNRGYLTGNRGFGRGIMGLSRGSVNRALHSGQGGANKGLAATPSTPLSSAAGGMSSANKRAARNRRKRNSGSIGSLLGPIPSLTQQMSGGGQSWGQQSLNSPFLSPTQSQYSRREQTRDMSGRSQSFNQSPGRNRSDRRTDDSNDPVALMQYLKTRLEKMEEKMTGGDRDQDRGYNKGRGGGRSQRDDFDDRYSDGEGRQYDRGGFRNDQGGSRWQDDYGSSSRDGGQRNWNDRGSNSGQGGNQQNRGQARRGKKRKSDTFGGIDAKRQQSNFGQAQQTASYFGGGSGFKSMSDQNSGYGSQMSQWGSSASSNQTSSQFGAAASPIQTLPYPPAQQGLGSTGSSMGYSYSGMGSSSLGQSGNMSGYSQGQGTMSGYSQGQGSLSGYSQGQGSISGYSQRQSRWN